MKKIALTIGFLFSVFALHATHQKAAEITFRHISGYTYHITLVTYTYTRTEADRPTLLIHYGYADAYENLTRIQEIFYPDGETKENRYEVRHTFPSPGTYFISMEDPNRNGGVVNMPNSINTPIYIESKLVINPWITPANSSPELLNKPVDQGCLGVPFMHNTGAVDPDGDSLSYRLVACRGVEGTEIAGYHYPDASKTLEINPITGDLLWDSPMSTGEFNIAIAIDEYRDGMNVGTIVRDMQIAIQVCENRPPELHVAEELCALVGDTLRIPVKATDPDTADFLELSARSGILELNSHKIGINPLFDTLAWVPQHRHVQEQPHPVYFRARDNGRPNLNTLKTLMIHVRSHAPKWVSITPTFTLMHLQWTPLVDERISGYRIYRTSSEATGITQESCDYGMSDSTYQLIAEIPNNTISVFMDTAVNQHLRYCYRILAVYKNGLTTQMSDEICESLLSNTPIIERVSVRNTDVLYGEMDLAWHSPLDFNVIMDSAYVHYVIHRSLGSGNFQAIDTVSDTSYIDKNLNTEENLYYYKIELILITSDSTTSIGFSGDASSISANATGRNRRVNVQWYSWQPWKAEGFAIYRKRSWQSNFDSIGYTQETFFTDTTVVNDTSYTYKIKGFGRHYNERINDYILLNWSQETSAIPQLDTPCTPDLTLDYSLCKPAENGLSWQPLDEDCNDESSIYHIFYTPSKKEVFREIAVQSENTFIHTELSMNIGCYYVLSRNAKELESEPSDTVCVDTRHCLQYELPNIFTPNSDNINDHFKALPNEYSGSFSIHIYNRWGVLVFESNNPDFAWDGKNHTTKKDCPEGAYFYVAELLVPALEGVVKETLSGSITLLR